MFEQSFYNAEEPAPPTHEGDFLHEYEIRSWKLTPRIYKILAASAVFNLLVLVIAGQTSVLTMKGCDSPLVGRVCQVLDTVYVGSMLLGTDRDYVDAVYERTELGDADITFIDVTGETPPLTYPEGYFQIANPEEYAMRLAMANDPNAGFDTSGFPGFPTMPSAPSGGGLLNTTPNLPKANPNAVKGDISSDLFSIEEDGEDAAAKNDKGKKGDGNANTDQQTAENKEQPKADPTSPVTEKFNNRPFKDMAVLVNELLAKGEVRLNEPFILRASGKLNNEGKLDQKSFRFLEVKSNDEEMIAVIKRAIEALNESGRLQYLKALSGKDLVLDLRQDEVNLSAIIQSELAAPETARSISSGLNLLMSMERKKKEDAVAAMEAANDPAKAKELADDKDDLELLKHLEISPDGKKIVIKFTVPQAIAQKMIERKLAEQQAEMQKSNGTALLPSNDNTARK